MSEKIVMCLDFIILFFIFSSYLLILLFPKINNKLFEKVLPFLKYYVKFTIIFLIIWLFIKLISKIL